MYCVALHCGACELKRRALLRRIALECDHLRGRHPLSVVHLGDASFPAVRERVKVGDVFFVCEDSWSLAGGLELLQRALGSSEFRRLETLGFRGRIHSSRCQVS